MTDTKDPIEITEPPSVAGKLTIRDRIGGTLFHASEAWISKPPNDSFAGATTREWVLRCVPSEPPPEKNKNTP